MKFVLEPSLEHMALVKIVLSLWNQKDVSALMAKLDLSHYFMHFSKLLAEWRIIEYRVREKVPQLPLPQLLKEKVLSLVEPMGLEVLTWMQYNHKYLNVNLPVELCWSPHGTIDRKKTAEGLVKNENLDMCTRYKLACIYCLEDVDMHELWYSFSEDLMESLLDSKSVIKYWSCSISGLCYAPISYKDEFNRCAIQGNKVAAEFFLQKLSAQERKEWLVNATKNVEDEDTLCFLISEMDSDQQMEIFRYIPYDVLHCFLKWPLQSFFIGVSDCMWDFLSEEDYNDLLNGIIKKHVHGYRDWNYQQLFNEFWQKSPNALKSYITEKMDENPVLDSLFDIKDKENIRIILKHATLTVKEKLMYDAHIMQCCQYSIRDDEWDFLEFCIRECLPSKKAMLKFKKEFGKYMMRGYFKQHFAAKKQKWEQLFSCFDGSICKYDKRSVEEGESSSSKRFHSLH